MFTEKEILAGLIILGVNPRKYLISFKNIVKGVQVELEHGLKAHRLDVTHSELIPTLKIALVHLLENPHYYQLLEKATL